MRLRRICLILIVLPLVLAGLASAQLSTSATISGTVTDSSGAIIPGADVLVESTDTHTGTHHRTSAEGTFVVPGLPVGTYSVTVTKPGFDVYQATGIVLHPALTSTVDVKLSIGNVSTSVSVSAAQTQIEVSTSGEFQFG